jgi:hypothetical protein
MIAFLSFEVPHLTHQYKSVGSLRSAHYRTNRYHYYLEPISKPHIFSNR